MILRFETTQVRPQRVFQIIVNGTKVTEGCISERFHSNIFLDNDQYNIDMDSIKGAYISKNSERIGFIKETCVVTKKILFFIPAGWQYFSMTIQEKDYQVYQSGMGADKHFYSLYKDGDVAGVIHQDDLEKNYCVTCTLYSETEDDMKILLIFATYLGATYFYRIPEVGVNSVEDGGYFTMQKEENEKYDPTFIPRIIAMDTIEKS